MLVEETDHRFEVRGSTIPGAGRGLFARVFLLIGNRLEVVGVLVPADSPADACTQYADHHKFRVGDNLLIPLGFGAMVNHSTTPNMMKVIEEQRVFLEVIRPVSPGEEMVFTYPESALQRFGIS